jgi:thiamine pyrophosphokinase
MKSCVIIGASPEFYWDSRIQPDLVICADGGWLHAKRHGISADIIISDDDSGGEGFAGKRISLPAEKDATDYEECLNYGLRMGAKRFYLLGAGGGRLDHFLANLNLLDKLDRHGADGLIIDRDNEIFLYKPGCVLEDDGGFRYFSVIPIDAELSGVTITGAKYPLSDVTVGRASSFTVSNEWAGRVTIQIGAGAAFIVKSGRRRVYGTQ